MWIQDADLILIKQAAARLSHPAPEPLRHAVNALLAHCGDDFRVGHEAPGIGAPDHKTPLPVRRQNPRAQPRLPNIRKKHTFEAAN